MAALGLVHDVGGDKDRRAPLGGEGVEEVPQVAAQDGVESDGRFVEDEEFGRTEEGDGEGYAAALAAGEGAGECVRVGGEVDVVDGPGDGFPAGVAVASAGPQDGREVVEVLPDGEVGVDGRGLGDVPDAWPEGGVAGRVAEDVEGAGDLGLGADDGAHERALSAAEGPRRPVILPGSTVKPRPRRTVRSPRTTVRARASTAGAGSRGGSVRSRA